MGDTPRTDALRKAYQHEVVDRDLPGVWEWAEQLERENAELERQIERMKPVVDAVAADCDLAAQDQMRPELRCDCDVCKALRAWQRGRE